MAIVHVLPIQDLATHQERGADCWCEPRVEDCGTDDAGEPARVIVHHSLNRRERHEGQN